MRKLKGADGIRAIACLMVIVHHLFKRLHDGGQILPIHELQYLTKTFSAGVSAFFVLSGFLLSYPFWSAYIEKKSFPDLKIYTMRRVARIVPGFYVSLSFCFIMTLLFIPEAINPVQRFISGLTFTSALSWETLFPAELNGPLWSIGFEVLCYLLLPVVMLGLFKVSKKRDIKVAITYWIAVFLCVISINGLIQLHFETDDFRKSWEFGLTGGAKVWWPNYNPIGFFAQYIFGVIAAAAVILIGKNLKKKGLESLFRFDVIAAITGFLLIVLLWQMRNHSQFFLSFQKQPYYFPLFPIGVAIMLIMLPYTRYLGNILDNRLFKITALLSFGLYIWHNVILELTRMFIFPQYTHGGMDNVLPWALISGAALIASFIAAALSWKFIEEPVLKWAHSKEKSLKTISKPMFSATMVKSGIEGVVVNNAPVYDAMIFNETAPVQGIYISKIPVPAENA